MNAARPIAVLAFLTVLFPALAADNMKAFPPADAGMVRHVLLLPQQNDEAAFKVELIVGKTVELDEGNRYFFAGKIEEETIEGWGFPRYMVTKLGPMAGTLMAVDPDAPKVSRFITLGGDGRLRAVGRGGTPGGKEEPRMNSKGRVGTILLLPSGPCSTFSYRAGKREELEP